MTTIQHKPNMRLAHRKRQVILKALNPETGTTIQEISAKTGLSQGEIKRYIPSMLKEKIISIILNNHDIN